MTDYSPNRNWPGNTSWRRRLLSQLGFGSYLDSSHTTGQLSGLLPWVATSPGGPSLSPCLQTQSPRFRHATRIGVRSKTRRMSHMSEDWPWSLITNSRGSAPTQSAHLLQNQLLVL